MVDKSTDKLTCQSASAIPNTIPGSPAPLPMSNIFKPVKSLNKYGLNKLLLFSGLNLLNFKLYFLYDHWTIEECKKVFYIRMYKIQVWDITINIIRYYSELGYNWLINIICMPIK